MLSLRCASSALGSSKSVVSAKMDSTAVVADVRLVPPILLQVHAPHAGAAKPHRLVFGVLLVGCFPKVSPPVVRLDAIPVVEFR